MRYALLMALIEVPQRVIDRIFERLGTQPEDQCWVWPGALASGYGRVGWRENGVAEWAAVHRIVWQVFHGEISAGSDLDHLCHDPKTCKPPTVCLHRRCSNPKHLEPVTRQENLARGGTVPAARAAVTHCPAGHEYSGGNLYTDKLERRFCRECVRVRNRAYYHKNKERRSEYNRQWRLKNIGKKSTDS